MRIILKSVDGRVFEVSPLEWAAALILDKDDMEIFKEQIADAEANGFDSHIECLIDSSFSNEFIEDFLDDLDEAINIPISVDGNTNLLN